MPPAFDDHERTFAFACDIVRFYTRRNFPFRSNRILFKETGNKSDELMAAAIHKLPGRVAT